jgi:hypothetical protein
MIAEPDTASAGEIRQIAEQLLTLDRGSIVKPLTLVTS